MEHLIFFCIAIFSIGFAAGSYTATEYYTKKLNHIEEQFKLMRTILK